MADRPSVSLVGIGPWDEGHLTQRAAERLAEDVPIFSPFAPEYHPVIRRLSEEGRVISLFSFYESEEVPHRQKYEIFAEVVTRAARQFGRALMLVPGNPYVYDAVSGMVIARCEAEGVDVEIVPGLSSVEAIFAELRLDPGARGMHMLNAYLFNDQTVLDTHLPTMLLQVMWPNIATVSRTLLRWFPAEHELTIAQCAGYDGGGKYTKVPIGQLAETLSRMAQAGVNDSLISIVIPAVPDPTTAAKRAERAFKRTHHQVVEKELMEGGLLLIPMQLFASARDVADIQVVLDQPEYLQLWRLLRERRTLGELTAALGELVRGEEHVAHLLMRLSDHGLVEPA